MLGHGGDEVAGDQHAVRRQRPYGVRRHGRIAQPYHQRRSLGRKQRLKLAAHRPDRPLKKVRLALPEGGQVNGEVAALGLAQRRLALFVQNIHPREGVSLQLGFGGLDAGEPGGPFRGFLPEFPGLQCQVGAFDKHVSASQHKMLWLCP